MSTSKPDPSFKEAVHLHPFFKGMERCTALSLFNESQRIGEVPLGEVGTVAASMLNTLWKAQVPVPHILDFMTGIFDRLYKRIVQVVEVGLEREGVIKPCPYAFYVMGSAGRKEQFLITDQDHFLVFEEHSKEADEYYQAFADRVVRTLESAGWRLCDGGMMANQKAWRGSVGSWQERMREWSVHSSEETFINVQNFLSYRFIDGNEDLHISFEEMIEEELQRSKILFARLAQLENTKQIPVLQSAIRSLLGMSRKTVSVKKEILFPFHHALQILNAAHGNTSGGTREKIDYLMGKHSISSEFAEELTDAFHGVMALYMDIKQSGKGETVQIATISASNKERIVRNVKTIREFQQMMLSHYSLL
ncbi:DUF294 nucleotidyltransferase-like domain-containing protein [Bacillus sp. AFS015802]|uniref:DUF294 nucleotidyltransferase-like domain-containing protein n=1 Tax=Bacillus sp. AFS015802 TaxID=2033486 RepID=UPI0015CF0512|nr:DUF294 nucleotidyltransferase-like domain-containing protein [Bacillus sp. AFS015802]